MTYKEPKLRPSITWSDIQLTIEALDFTIRSAVQAKQVTLKTAKQATVKAYLESLKPAAYTANQDADPMAALIAAYGSMPDMPSMQTTVSEELETRQAEQLTDDQRYDMLVLRDSSSYTKEEEEFMCNIGTPIMIKRAMKQRVKTEDL